MSKLVTTQPLKSYKKKRAEITQNTLNAKDITYLKQFHNIPAEANLKVSVLPNGVFKYEWSWYETVLP